jgi:hypothetical protein
LESSTGPDSKFEQVVELCHAKPMPAFLISCIFFITVQQAGEWLGGLEFAYFY